jgi:hypothetical protein
LREDRAEGPIDHKIEVSTLPAYLAADLGFDPSARIGMIDWLVTPQQALLSVTAGRVFHDGLGSLESLRARLAYYPDQIWLYMLGAQWQRISQQEPFVGRTGEVGDEIGSRLIAADLARDLMRLGFLIERRYAPYSKWLGTAFATLECAAKLSPLLQRALTASTWREREAPLALAYELMARRFNDLGVTAPVDPTTRSFFGRPFRVLFAGRFVDAINDAIVDPEVRALIDRAGWIGGIDQISDNVDLKTNAEKCARLREIYSPETEESAQLGPAARAGFHGNRRARS